MKRYKKPNKFYALLLLITFVLMGGYTLYLHFTDQIEAMDIWNLFLLPLLFVGVYFGGDTLLQKITDKRYKNNHEDRFLELVNVKMRESNQFLVEDFRRLQINPKFQESLKMALYIYQNGENEIFNCAKLLKKFDSKTVEGKAMNCVVELLNEKIENKSV